MRPPPRRPLARWLRYDRTPVEHGPLPPHERTWRHPSELAAEERAALQAETAPSNHRVVALASGALGLVMIGMLVLAVTPRGNVAPVAVSATTTPAPVQVSTGGSLATGVRNPAAAAPDATTPALEPGLIEIALGAPALATPIGDGRRALITRSAASENAGGRLDVVVPSGRQVDGRLVGRYGNNYVVELDEPEQAHAIASEMPSDDEIVTVLSDPPVEVPLQSLADLDVDEGTAVLDADGELIGLCSHDELSGRPRLVSISVSPGDATTADR